jgi:hypothetical protein
MSHVEQGLRLGGLRLLDERASAVRCNVNTAHMRLTASAWYSQSVSQSVSQAVSVNYRRELQKARGKLVVES